MARTTNNWGCDVTIAIAGFVPARDEIVSVSDARLSHGESIPAADDATMKNRKIATTWGMMFAAVDSTAFVPVVNAVQSTLNVAEGKREFKDADELTVQKVVQEAYEREFNERFFRENLARFGYADVSDFRRNGLAELGKDLYTQYAVELAKFDLGLELLVYGFDPDSGASQLFEVTNPGKITSHRLRGYAAIGSGSLMALAALNRKAITPGLPETIYRFLDAKFSSETARDVGRKTHVIITKSNGQHGILPQKTIEQIREIWEEKQKQIEPETALSIIANAPPVTQLLTARDES
jgi:hypothetical protein